MNTNPAHDDGQTPPPAGREPLFRVMYEAGLQAVGEPMRQGTGRLRIEISPTQMIRLHQELSSRAIIAMMLVLEEGYRPGKRIEIEGWSARWLIERGMPRTTAEKAAAELRDKGYIRNERMPGTNSPLGKKLGVVPSGYVEEVEDLPGLPRNDGRPATSGKKHQPYTPRLTDPADYRNDEQAVDDAVDTSVSALSGKPVPPERRSGNDTDVFPQVTAVSAPPPEGTVHSPTSSGSSSSEEEVFSLPGPGQALTRSDLTRFFAQSALTEAVSARWEVTVALVARELAAHSSRCAEVIAWLGDGVDEHPETRLAQILVDLVKTRPIDRFEAASAQEAFLRSRGVKFRQTTPDEFLAAFVISTVTALDSARPIESWGGWYGAGLKRDSQFQGKVLAGVLNVFRRLLDDPDGLLPPPIEAPATPLETTYAAEDPSYVERLRVAAQGTIWDDDVSFDKLLRNPGQQARVLATYAKRQAGGS